jgi:HD-GYP domain-containing protein (c-di-GMP phosphodiesterase class II)
VVDVLDALLTPRPYKPAWPLDFALDYIWQGRGTQFDPECAEALMDVASSLPPDWRAIAVAGDAPAPRRAERAVRKDAPYAVEPLASSAFIQSSL